MTCCFHVILLARAFDKVSVQCLKPSVSLFKAALFAKCWCNVLEWNGMELYFRKGVEVEAILGKCGVAKLESA